VPRRWQSLAGIFSASERASERACVEPRCISRFQDRDKRHAEEISSFRRFAWPEIGPSFTTTARRVGECFMHTGGRSWVSCIVHPQVHLGRSVETWRFRRATRRNARETRRECRPSSSFCSLSFSLSLSPPETRRLSSKARFRIRDTRRCYRSGIIDMRD